LFIIDTSITSKYIINYVSYFVKHNPKYILIKNFKNFQTAIEKPKNILYNIFIKKIEAQLYI